MQKEKDAKEMALTDDDKETLITFYKEHPMLWDSKLADYRNRDLRRVNLESLAEMLNHKYSIDKIQQEWHNLITIYERERARHEGSKKTGTGGSEVYVSKWAFYKCMEFSCDHSNPDEATSTLKHVAPQTKKSTKGSKEEEAKVKLWEALADKLSGKGGTNHDTNDFQKSWQDGFQAGWQQGWQQGFMQVQMQTVYQNNQMPMFHTFPPPMFRSSSPSSQSPSERSMSPGFRSRSTSPEIVHKRSSNAMSMPSNSPPQQSFHNFHPPEPPTHSSTDLFPLNSTPKLHNNVCFMCNRETKYKCVKCNKFACNICSHPADPNDDNYSEFGEIKSVSYCSDCFLHHY